MPTLDSSRQWLRYFEAAPYIGVTERQLRRAVAAGKVAYTKPGNVVLFTHEMLDEYIERCTFVPSDGNV